MFYAEIHGANDPDTSLTTAYFDTVTITTSSSLWSQTFSYDPFGNITKSGMGAFTPGYTFANGATTNQFQSIPGVSVSYDANGNLLTDNLNVYTWDPNWGNPAAINGTNLVYDALGRMVEQQSGSTYTQILYSQIGKTAIMTGQTLTKAFVSLPGGGAAIFNSSGLAYYRHADWLGSSRITSTAAGVLYSSTAYAPFGEQYSMSGTADASFTGQNSDTAASLYDFRFREYSMSQGRWISPDPAGLAVVDPRNPQSWNRYAYVFNNPLRFVDMVGFGKDCKWDDTTNTLTCPNAGGSGESGTDTGGFDLTGGDGGNDGGGNGGNDGGNNGGNSAANTGPGPIQKRIMCANKFANNHSVAAFFGAQNTFVGKALGGNIFGGIGELGVAVFGNGEFSSADGAALAYGGASLGIPVPGNHPGLNGAGGVVQDGIVKFGAQFGYNILTGGAQLSTEALEEVATGAGILKAAYDLGSYAYGLYKCGQ